MSDKVARAARFHETMMDRFDGGPLLHVLECGIMMCEPSIDLDDWDKGKYPIVGLSYSEAPYCKMCIQQLLKRVGIL